MEDDDVELLMWLKQLPIDEQIELLKEASKRAQRNNKEKHIQF